MKQSLGRFNLLELKVSRLLCFALQVQ
jgi:hypothetical protein